MIIPNWLLIVLIFVIFLLEYTIYKKQLGVVIIHDNDHTLNKIVQYLTAFFERTEIYFSIIVLKKQEAEAEATTTTRSTGAMFNIGYRQLGKVDGYLFLDSKSCNLENYFNLLVSPPPQLKHMYPQNTMVLVGDMCGVLISREYFKAIDGFSNQPNVTFKEFVRILKHDKQSKKIHGGYLSTNKYIKYHIVEKIQLTPHAARLLIKF
jgi:hypothetical protein